MMTLLLRSLRHRQVSGNRSAVEVKETGHLPVRSVRKKQTKSETTGNGCNGALRGGRTMVYGMFQADPRGQK